MENIISTNDLFNGGISETIFVNPFTKLKYSELIKIIAEETESYWLLDIIASYQSKLKNESFQVWKLERELAYTEVNDVKIVIQRKDVFNVVCEDGNDNVLLKQNIPFSDFKHDIYTLWLTDGTVILPSEY